jgi:voltage-dependent potassium channel beta subunit
MNYRRLGSAGLKLSEISLGTWITFGRQVSEAVAQDCLVAAYDSGVNFIDSAEAYAGGQAEAVLGRLLKKLGWRRGSYVVSTKFYWGLHDGPNERNTLNRKRLVEGIAGSLKRLGLEAVDLIFCHRPDPETPIEEVVRTMDDILHRGQAHYWGTSEWSAAEIAQAHDLARRYNLYPPQMEQPEYNLLQRRRVEVEYAPLCEAIGLGLTVYSPLAGGVLTGKYNAGVPQGSRASQGGMDWVREQVTPELIGQLNRLQAMAGELGCTLAQLALAWCLKNPRVSTVITGASRADQVRENVKAVAIAEQLTPDLVQRIDAIVGNAPGRPEA